MCFKIGETGISIHALREEGDRLSCPRALAAHISIHALREEGDGFVPSRVLTVYLFLSTPSARRATAGTGRSRK